MTHTLAHKLSITRAALRQCGANRRTSTSDPRGYVSRRTGELENKHFNWCCVAEV
ncbi:hypothetical protein [Cupriavidus lacunae]|uniref:hypothetical protein n=1 Tax=Cupriavidus lacunae TaxID=2666307 RepID=UPI001FC9115E|nr:hypothetical protein [Cupriavidus lacunae]